MLLDLQALEAKAVNPRPFDNIVIPGFVPPEALADVIADLPPAMPGGSLPRSAIRLGPRAVALLDALEGPEIRAAIAKKFALDLATAPTMLTLRGVSRERDGHIHRDSDAKLVTLLLYLNPANAAWAAEGGCLRLLRGPDNLDDFEVEVPPTDGTLLVFPNGPTAWHGHRRFLGRRYVVQMNYMKADAAARSELRRHRFSAFLKRLSRAA